MMRMLNLFYLYFLVLMLFTAYIHWFDGSVVSVLLLLFLLFFPLLAGKVLYRDKVIVRQMDDRKAAACHVEFFVAFYVLSLGSISSDATPSDILRSLFGIAAFCIFLYSKYYYGKYLILDCNPNVTKTTQRRAEQGGFKSFIRMFSVSLLLSLAVFALLFLLPDRKPESPGMVKHTVEKEQKPKREPAVRDTRPSGKIPIEEPEEEKVISVIIRYILLLTVLFGIVFIVFMAFYKLITFFTGRRRGTSSYEYREAEVERRGDEEYVALVPVVRRIRRFPDGNNGRVRRMFYQRVRSGAGKKSVGTCFTPSELKESYLGEGEEAEYLTVLYERARYGESPVTDGEMKRWERLKKSR